MPIYGADDQSIEIGKRLFQTRLTQLFLLKLGDWFAVNDARKHWSTGWSIPSNNDVDDLLLHFPDASGLKSTDGWKNEGNGTNASGYNGWRGCVHEGYTKMANMDLLEVTGQKQKAHGPVLLVHETTIQVVG